MNKEDKRCPHCGSDDILPHEIEEEHKDDYSLFIIILAALLLIIGYFLFVVSSYIYFPAFIFIFVFLSALFVKRSEKQQKKAAEVEKDYICLNCDKNFKM
jgi:predicted membrane protein